MSLESHALPLRLQEDDSEHNVECHNWPDLQLSSFSDTAKIPPEPTMLGHYYSRAMQIHARRYGGGHALLTPSIFRIPLPPIRPDYAIIGDIGLLWRGTFKPLWSPWTPGGTKIHQPRHPHSIHVRTFNDYDPRVYTKRIEPNEYPQVLEARLPGSSENGKDLYARLEVPDDSELQMVFCISDPRFMLAMCSSYDHLQELAPQLREDDRYKDLTGPMEYVMCTGGISALRWNTLVSDEMPIGAEYDSTKAPVQNGLGRRIESVGKVDEHTERAWVSIRFNKCLSRKVYKARGRLDESQRSVVDDVLEYILDHFVNIDVAASGHDDIDRFMAEASQSHEYKGLIIPSTTYTEFSAMLGKIIFPPITGLTLDTSPQRYKSSTTQGLSRSIRRKVADVFAKKQNLNVGVLCFASNHPA